MNDNHNEIIRKIRDLLSLYRGTSNRHEAEAAMQAAMRLAEQHRLTVAQVEAQSTNEPCRDKEPIIEVGRLHTWKINMLIGLCQANGCAILRERYGGVHSKVFLFGRPEDVLIVRELWAYAVSELGRSFGRVKDVVDRNSWWFGASIGVSEAIEKARDDVRQSADTQAIVLVDRRQDEVQEALSRTHPKIKTIRHRKCVVKREDYEFGRVEGKRVMERREVTQLEPKQETERQRKRIEPRTQSEQLGFDFGSSYNTRQRP